MGLGKGAPGVGARRTANGRRRRGPRSIAICRRKAGTNYVRPTNIRRTRTANFAAAGYCGGGGGGGGGGQVRRGLIGPQFRPILHSQPLACGCGVSQQTSSGDVGVGSTVVTGSVMLMRGAGTPPIPLSARANTAAPPHAAATVLAVRLAMAVNSNLSWRNVQRRYFARGMARYFVGQVGPIGRRRRPANLTR